MGLFVFVFLPAMQAAPPFFFNRFYFRSVFVVSSAGGSAQYSRSSGAEQLARGLVFCRSSGRRRAGFSVRFFSVFGYDTSFCFQKCRFCRF